MLYTLTVVLVLIGIAAIALGLIAMRGTIAMISGIGEDDGHGQVKGPPQLARGNKYRTVIPAPLVRSRSSLSPILNSSRMASRQEPGPEPSLVVERRSSSELMRISMRPRVAARPNWASNSCRK
jgi:hypothetical protein